ncbi:MAG: branched-chain amino acid ABC transporter permease [Alphaproteobacteria bacterium]
MDAAQSVFLSGIVLGSLYAMMATGLSLVWTTLGIFNFAHGIFMALGALIAWQLGNDLGWGLGPAAGLALGIAALIGIGFVAELILVRPFLARRDVVLIAVITTLSASIFFENGTLLIWGARYKQLDPLIEGKVGLLSTAISAHEVLIIAIAPLTLIALWLFLKFTRLGSAIRAVSQNRESALLMGMNVPLLYSSAFALSAGLAGLSGILLGSIRLITPALGNEPLVKSLIVAIFGGLGSLGGTIGAAYVIGLMEALGVFFIGLYWTPALLFGVMIVVLLVRPTGLFGRKG